MRHLKSAEPATVTDVYSTLYATHFLHSISSLVTKLPDKFHSDSCTHCICRVNKIQLLHTTMQYTYHY